MIEATQKPEITEEQILQSYTSLKYFGNTIFTQSFTKDEPYRPGNHLDEWADMMEEKNTCIISARKHSKSISIYKYLMWKLWQSPGKDLEILYISYKDKLAKYHIRRLKNMIRANPYFKQMKDTTAKTVEGIAKYSWDGKHNITIIPGGILSFERGRHPDILILDDVMADPSDSLNMGIINKINRLVMEVAFSLPKEDGETKVVGTAQTPIDFFFKLKDAPHFSWGIYPAILDWKNKKLLWEEMFSWDRLMEIREHETGHKGFEKEFMCKPVWSADSFFKMESFQHSIDNNLQNYNSLKTMNDIGIGWDIGKHSHPAYVTAFEFIPTSAGEDMAVQRHIKWMDGWEYTKQLEYVTELAKRMKADYVNYDNTRGELEGFWEQGKMDKKIFFPIAFSLKMKHQLATEYEKRVNRQNLAGEYVPTIKHINHQRSINQVLSVTNDLDAVQTHEGHADSFWGNALALYRRRTGDMKILQDLDNVTGLY